MTKQVLERQEVRSAVWYNVGSTIPCSVLPLAAAIWSSSCALPPPPGHPFSRSHYYGSELLHVVLISVLAVADGDDSRPSLGFFTRD